MGNKNTNFIFCKSKRQLKSPERKIGVRAAKSSGDRAGQSRGRVGGNREKMPQSEVPGSRQGKGQLLQISERSKMTTLRCGGCSLVVKTRLLFATQNWGAPAGRRSNVRPALILRHRKGRSK